MGGRGNQQSDCLSVSVFHLYISSMIESILVKQITVIVSAPLYLRTLWRYTNAVVTIIIIIIILSST